MTTLIRALAKISPDEARKTIRNAFVEAARNKLNVHKTEKWHSDPIHIQAAIILSTVSTVHWRTLYRLINELDMWKTIDEEMARMGVKIHRIKDRGPTGPRKTRPKKKHAERGLALVGSPGKKTPPIHGAIEPRRDAGGTPDIRRMRESERRRRHGEPSAESLLPSSSKPPPLLPGGEGGNVVMDSERRRAFDKAIHGIREKGKIRGLEFTVPTAPPVGSPEEEKKERKKREARKKRVQEIAEKEIKSAASRKPSSPLVKERTRWKPPGPHDVKGWFRQTGLPDPDVEDLFRSIRSNDPGTLEDKVNAEQILQLAKAGRTFAIVDGKPHMIRIHKADVDAARQQLADETERLKWIQEQKTAGSLSREVFSKVYGLDAGVTDIRQAGHRVIEASNNLDKLTFMWELGKRNPDPLGLGEGKSSSR